MRLRTTTLAAVFATALTVAPALAQGPLFLRATPSTSDPAAAAGFVLVPPAVYGGPAYGMSGYGYYFDEPSEGPSLRMPSNPRASSARALR